jgi:hypothetical protein
VRDDELMIGNSGVARAVEHFIPLARPSDVDFPDFRRHQPGRKTFVALLAIATALMAGVAWTRHLRSADLTAGAVAPAQGDRAAARAPEPVGTKPVMSPAPVPREATPASAAAPENAEETSLRRKVEAAVPVKTIPRRAVVLKRARKPPAAPVQQSDSPFDDSSHASSSAVVPVPAAEPLPESPATAAPETAVAPSE